MPFVLPYRNLYTYRDFHCLEDKIASETLKSTWKVIQKARSCSFMLM